MKIAQIAPLQVAVPPKHYGGTERVIANLVEALVQLGHDVTLFASGDSQTGAELVPGADEAFNFDPTIEANAYHLAMLGDIYRQADRFDVLHSHLDYLTLPFTRWTTTPTILTMHGRLDLSHHARVFGAYPEVNYVSISRSQQSFLPHLNWVGTVHHSVDVDSFPFRSTPGDYLVFVGRVSPEKGLDHAIAIAKRAGVPLKVAAKMDWTDQRYFEQVIEPLLDDPIVEYLGPVGEERKRELMLNSLALLLPIQWDEPFGMVFIEALACGTPVLTCPRGSVPELLRDGVTGYACDDDDDLVAAVKRVRGISREGCRAYAKRHFDIHRLALEYVNIYGRVRQRKSFFSLVELEAEPQITQTVASARTRGGLDVVTSIGPTATSRRTPKAANDLVVPKRPARRGPERLAKHDADGDGRTLSRRS